MRKVEILRRKNGPPLLDGVPSLEEFLSLCEKHELGAFAEVQYRGCVQRAPAVARLIAAEDRCDAHAAAQRIHEVFDMSDSLARTVAEIQFLESASLAGLV